MKKSHSAEKYNNRNKKYNTGMENQTAVSKEKSQCDGR